jgi:hypothetical protein
MKTLRNDLIFVIYYASLISIHIVFTYRKKNWVMSWGVIIRNRRNGMFNSKQPKLQYFLCVKIIPPILGYLRFVDNGITFSCFIGYLRSLHIHMYEGCKIYPWHVVRGLNREIHTLIGLQNGIYCTSENVVETLKC